MTLTFVSGKLVFDTESQFLDLHIHKEQWTQVDVSLQQELELSLSQRLMELMCGTF
jgi:hypothetical protein